jgi:type IV pilus assembly protein PilB
MKSISSVENQLPLIVQLLGKDHEFDTQKMAAIRAAQVKENSALEELLIRKGYASDHEIAAAYAEYYMLPQYDAEKNPPQIDRRLRRMLTEKLCRDHFIAPVAVRGQLLEVAFFTPNELLLVDELQLITGREIQPLFAPLSVVERLLNALFNDSEWPAGETHTASASAQFEQVEDHDENDRGEDSLEEVLHLDQPPPPGRDGRVIRFVNQIFEQAFRGGASDVHIEPFEDRCRVRLRIDGSLTEITPPPVSMYTPIVSRIKVLAKMDIAEKRLPQDGAISLKSGEKRVDVRVNTCPTVHGEKVVMRILDKNAIPLKLTSLGLDERQDKDLAESIQSPHGMMLVTGPTGSGKSTTLYACLNLLNTPDTNICTVEDPVEYKFQGINQIQTKAHIGLTFADALRSFLRQDPDVIMVGEVRDSETAQICLRAALTGHFVLSTLHTNDALAAVNRLADMGVEPFLLASTLRVVVAQRLIRRLCQKCREQDVLDATTTNRLGLGSDEVIYRPRGCGECRQTGYKGRVGVFEVIRITRRLSDLIQNRAPLAELRQAAVDQGMKLLSQSAMEKARQGLTSLEEVLSITLSEEK